jgi:CAAX prenyl protease-like protein
LSEVVAPAPRTRAESGWLPYLAPYFAFLVITELQARPFGEGSLLLWLLRVAVPTGLLLHYFRRGSFPELRGFRPTAAGVGGDVLLGIAIAALWVVPFEVGWLAKPEAASRFDPDQLGPALREVVLGLRLFGFAAVTPFLEELFVRSFLIRAAQLIRISPRSIDLDLDADFRDLPVARFAWQGFLVTVLFFTFSHVQWQWPVALLTGVAWNLWLYQRGHLLPLVISHAVANLCIFLLTVLGSGRLQDAQGRLLDLWYQL